MSQSFFRIFMTAAVCIAAVSCGKVDPQPSFSAPGVVGHKGAADIAPENTFASLDSCIRYDVEFMELDVMTSMDGVFYVIDRDDLSLKTDGEGLLSECLSSYVDGLDAGIKHGPQWAGQPVPRLEAMLEYVKPYKTRLLLDIDSCNVKSLVALIKRTGSEDKILFTTKNDWMMEEFIKEWPDNRNLQAYTKKVEDIDRIISLFHPEYFAMKFKYLNQEIVDYLHSRGLKVFSIVMDPDEDERTPGWEEEINRANKLSVEFGVDFISTDHPKALKAELARR